MDGRRAKIYSGFLIAQEGHGSIFRARLGQGTALRNAALQF
jgi:hypothetical protein